MSEQAAPSAVESLCEHLRPLLRAELTAGNRVSDARRDRDGAALAVLLEQPLLVAVFTPPPPVVFEMSGDAGEQIAAWSGPRYRCTVDRHVLGTKRGDA